MNHWGGGLCGPAKLGEVAGLEEKWYHLPQGEGCCTGYWEKGLGGKQGRKVDHSLPFCSLLRGWKKC